MLRHACLFVTLIFCVTALAEDDGDYLLSERTYEALNVIHQHINDSQYGQALTRLQTLRGQVEGNRYETAVVDQTMGYAYNGLGQYDRAAASFIAAVESNSLPGNISHQLRYYIAQLLAQGDDSERALVYLERWLRDTDSPDVNAHRFAAHLYYQQRNMGKVTEHARAAIARSDRPDESLYQLLLASHFESKQYSEAAKLLERMLELFPSNQEYWRQLAGTYQLMNQDKKALAVNELAYRQGLLQEDDKLQLARQYLHLQAPYRAARFLRQELQAGGIPRTARNLQLLADSYYMARETEAAADTLAEAAAAAANQGALHYRHGQLRVQLEDWEQALGALQQAVTDEGLEFKGEAYLLLGIAAHRLENPELAMESFRQARQHGNTREQAEHWLQQLEREAAEQT